MVKSLDLSRKRVQDMPSASMERISIGLLLIRKYNIFVRGASSPCNGNHVLVGERARRYLDMFMEARDIYRRVR